MTLFQPLPEAAREPTEGYKPPELQERDVEQVAIAGGHAWLKRRDGGGLLEVLRQRPLIESSNPWRPGSVKVIRTERRAVDGMGNVGGGHRAVEVQYELETMPRSAEDLAAAQADDRAKAEVKQRKANPLPAPANALARYAFLRDLRGAAQVVDAFVQRDIGLRLVGGKVVPVPLVPAKHIAPDEADAVVASAPLTAPYLRDGTEPPCPAKHKGSAVAVMVVGDGVTVCEPHGSGAVTL